MKELRDFNNYLYYLVECDPGYYITETEAGMYVEYSAAGESPYKNCTTDKLYYSGPTRLLFGAINLNYWQELLPIPRKYIFKNGQLLNKQLPILFHQIKPHGSIFKSQNRRNFIFTVCAEEFFRKSNCIALSL